MLMSVILCVAPLLSLLSRMPYTEFLRLWDEAVQALDAKDWQGALVKLEQISEPTSRTLFNAATAHLALGQLDLAVMVCVFCVGADSPISLFWYLIITSITTHNVAGPLIRVYKILLIAL